MPPAVAGQLRRDDVVERAPIAVAEMPSPDSWLVVRLIGRPIRVFGRPRNHQCVCARKRRVAPHVRPA